MDDFGTGYSSLAALKRHAIAGIKVDRSFVRELPQSRGDTGIIMALVAMAHALGIHVTAEGIETEDQFEILRDIGCNPGHGYLLGKPKPDPQSMWGY